MDKHLPRKASPSLRDLQIQYRAAVKSEAPVRDLPWITQQAPLSTEKRIRIYQYAWWIRLFESLEDDYSVLARCLGKRAFSKLIRDYLATSPSRSYTLAHAGNRLPEFLSRWRNSAKKPWMFDVSKVERLLYQAFHAKDAEAWDPASIATLSPEQASQLKLKLQPAAALVKTRWELSQILSGKSRKPRLGNQYLLIYRDGFVPKWRTLNGTQFRLLKLVEINRGTLGALLTAAGDEPWLEWLGEWARLKVLTPEIKSQR